MAFRHYAWLLSVGVLTGIVPSIPGQQQPPGAFRAPPQQQIINQPAYQTQAASPQPQFPTPQFNYNPYLPNPNNYPGYYPGPVGGYLNGVAAVTTANAQSVGTIQEARIVQQQANQSSLDTRRALLNEWQYEQKMRPTPQATREKDNAYELRRARNDPPKVEIWDGSVFNNLLKSIQQMQLGGLRGPFVPLDPDLVRHINLTAGATAGNVGLLKAGGKLDWPFALKGEAFAPDRGKMDALAAQAVREAVSGEVSYNTLTSMIKVVDSLRASVDGQVQEMSPNTWMQASRFVNELRSTTQALKSPNVSKQFSGEWSARGKDVAEVVYNMTQQGLKFAPVTSGNEFYYTAFYQSLLSYEQGLNRLVSR